MRVVACVELFAGGGAQVSEVACPAASNVSSSVTTDPELVGGGYRGFQLSSVSDEVVSRLDGTCRLFSESGYPGFLSRQLATPNPLLRSSSYPFSEPLVFEIQLFGRADYLFITFDEVSGEYATAFELYNEESGNSILVDDNQETTARLDMRTFDFSETTTLLLYVYRWSTPYASAKITKIATTRMIEYTGKDLISFRCSENIFPADLAVTPGLVEQFAEATVCDRGGLLRALAQRGELPEGCAVAFYAIEGQGSTQVRHALGEYQQTEWRIENDDSRVNITCADLSAVFDATQLSAISAKTRSVHDMLTLGFSCVEGVSWRYVDEDTRRHCMTVITPHNWFYTGTVRDLLSKVCTLGLLRIYAHMNTFIVVRCW